MHGRGHRWQGVCGRGHAWQGRVRGKGACVVEETVTAVGGTHPTGMYSCCKLCLAKYSVSRNFYSQFCRYSSVMLRIY